MSASKAPFPRVNPVAWNYDDGYKSLVGQSYMLDLGVSGEGVEHKVLQAGVMWIILIDASDRYDDPCPFVFYAGEAELAVVERKTEDGDVHEYLCRYNPLDHPSKDKKAGAKTYRHTFYVQAMEVPEDPAALEVVREWAGAEINNDGALILHGGTKVGVGNFICKRRLDAFSWVFEVSQGQFLTEYVPVVVRYEDGGIDCYGGDPEDLCEYRTPEPDPEY